MLSSNQVMLREVLALMKEEPPILIDWLPLNHTFGGNHNVGLVLFNGGSLYIDDGKPTPGGLDAAIRNLREIAPTIYFNVPKGWEMPIPRLRADRTLREHFFSRLSSVSSPGPGSRRTSGRLSTISQWRPSVRGSPCSRGSGPPKPPYALGDP